MDLLQKSTHEIIKGRSYSNNLKTVKTLGKFCTSFLKVKKIASVVKHAPGHGCANVDSHKKLPVEEKCNSLSDRTILFNSSRNKNNPYNLFKFKYTIPYWIKHFHEEKLFFEIYCFS